MSDSTMRDAAVSAVRDDVYASSNQRPMMHRWKTIERALGHWGETPMPPTAEKILHLVRQAGYLPIEALVRQCRVTPQTIRVDLNALADEGLLARHHGGAAVASSVTNTDH